MTYTIGVDLGGTNIAAAVVRVKDAHIISKLSVPTPVADGQDAIAEAITLLVADLTKTSGIASSEIARIGIGIPGTVSHRDKTVIYACNLPFEQGYPIAYKVEQATGITTSILNDADAAAYGEYVVDETHPTPFIAITLGTGVGSGVIMDGKVVSGFNGAGGELGHTTLIMGGQECGCKRRGCWEAYASASALVRQTEEAIRQHPDSLLAHLAEKTGTINGKLPFDAAELGCSVAQKVLEQYRMYVAEGLANVVNIFQPEKIVIGGGISNQGESFVGPVREYVYQHEYNRYLSKTKIETAQLSNDAGIIGAALYAE